MVFPCRELVSDEEIFVEHIIIQHSKACLYLILKEKNCDSTKMSNFNILLSVIPFFICC